MGAPGGCLASAVVGWTVADRGDHAERTHDRDACALRPDPLRCIDTQSNHVELMVAVTEIEGQSAEVGQ